MGWCCSKMVFLAFRGKRLANTTLSFKLGPISAAPHALLPHIKWSGMLSEKGLNWDGVWVPHGILWIWHIIGKLFESRVFWLGRENMTQMSSFVKTQTDLSISGFLTFFLWFTRSRKGFMYSYLSVLLKRDFIKRFFTKNRLCPPGLSSIWLFLWSMIWLPSSIQLHQYSFHVLKYQTL